MGTGDVPTHPIAAACLGPLGRGLRGSQIQVQLQHRSPRGQGFPSPKREGGRGSSWAPAALEVHGRGRHASWVGPSNYSRPPLSVPPQASISSSALPSRSGESVRPPLEPVTLLRRNSQCLVRRWLGGMG
ncbi:hypothetical protein NDU88_002335 [Pleurodeles waltl]|uniref:Uncharacterized protein n=1 Tax=Pleurodeles waltl TaxID=8319 RepID=A0AAV7M326_PLEWA|nr:hypothetical protein NDU88_002335 [Pleurodeles waltl]